MQRQGKNFVETLCEGLRDLENERIRFKEQKYVEANQQAIIKQRNAKRSLIELQESTIGNRKSFGSKENSFINAWDSDEKNQDQQQEQMMIKTARPHTHTIRRRQIRPHLGNSENLIPQLKNLLRRLQSPQKKREHEFDANNFALQLKRDLSSRRKDTVKVGDLLKIQQNNWTSCPMRDPDRPLRSAQQRLNLNPPQNKAQQFVVTQRSSCNRFEPVRQEEVVDLIRRKRLQQSHSSRKQTPRGILSASIKKTMPKEKEKKPREKLTLIELLQ